MLRKFQAFEIIFLILSGSYLMFLVDEYSINVSAPIHKPSIFKILTLSIFLFYLTPKALSLVL